jgi:hypothetical protein
MPDPIIRIEVRCTTGAVGRFFRSVENYKFSFRVVASPTDPNQTEWSPPVKLGIEEDRLRYLRFRFPSDDDLEKMGKELAKGLFKSDIPRIFYTSLERTSGKPLRLFFYPEKGAPLVVSMIPWECVFAYVLQDEEHLGLSQFVSVARYVPRGDLPPLKVEGGLRILAAASNPDKSEQPLDVVRALDLLEERVKQRPDGALEFFKLPNAQWEEFRKEVVDKRPHVLIFLGHGTIEKNEPHLIFQTADGRGDPISMMKLEAVLRPQVVGNLRVVMLTACRTGVSASKKDPLGSAAGRLIRIGVPAVVAMQSKVEEEAAKEFCLSFFNYLLQPQYPVDVCVNAGRLAMVRTEIEMSNGRGTQWAIPVLYLSTRTETLFDFSSSSAVNPEVEKRRPIQKSNFKSKAKPFVERPALVERLEADLDSDGMTVVSGQYGAGKTQLISAFCTALIDSQTASDASPPLFLYVECRDEWATFDDLLAKLNGQAAELGFKGFAELLGERRESLEENVAREGLDLQGLRETFGRSRPEDEERSIMAFIRLLARTPFVIVFDDYIWDGPQFWRTLFARMAGHLRGSKVYVVASTGDYAGAAEGYTEIGVAGFEPSEAEAFFKAEAPPDEATLGEMMQRAEEVNYLPWYVRLIREVFNAGGQFGPADSVDDYAEKLILKLDAEMDGAPGKLLKQLSVLRESISLRGLASMLDAHDPSQFLKAAYALRKSLLSFTRELKVEMAAPLKQYYRERMSEEEREYYNWQAAEYYSRRAEDASPARKSPDELQQAGGA